MATFVSTVRQTERTENSSRPFGDLLVESSARTPQERAERVRRATNRDIRAGVRVTKAMYRPTT